MSPEARLNAGFSSFTSLHRTPCHPEPRRVGLATVERGLGIGGGGDGFRVNPQGSGLPEHAIVGVRVADSRRFCHPRRIDVRGGGSALQTDTEETTVIMNATASRLFSSLVPAAAALLMTVGASAQAQELQPAAAPIGVYAGATAGPQTQLRQVPDHGP